MATSGYSGSIQYVLDANSSLNSFPFIKREITTTSHKYTPETLNEALGGSIGGSPESSSLLGSIIGKSAAASFVPGVGWAGSLDSISPSEAYWLKPPSGTFDTTTTIDGLIRNPSSKYFLFFGANLVSVPFTENRDFGEAVNTGSSANDPTALQNIGVRNIIGEGVAATWNPANDSWIGSLVSGGFLSGSGYWFKTTTTGLHDIWKPLPSPLQPEEWHECTDRGVNNNINSAQYAYRCYRIADVETVFRA